MVPRNSVVSCSPSFPVRSVPFRFWFGYVSFRLRFVSVSSSFRFGLFSSRSVSFLFRFRFCYVFVFVSFRCIFASLSLAFRFDSYCSVFVFVFVFGMFFFRFDRCRRSCEHAPLLLTVCLSVRGAQIAGEAGAGKTQLCLQLLLQVRRGDACQSKV